MTRASSNHRTPTPGQSAARLSSPKSAPPRILRARPGFALPAVLLFILFAFGAWAVLFRSGASILRVEQARTLRDTRGTWSAPAMGAALRLLQTGDPPADPYACKLTLTQDGLTRYYRLNYEKIGPVRWTVTATITDVDDTSPDAPATFMTIPAAPATLNATSTGTTSIQLTWPDVAHDTGYLIERSPNGSNSWVQIGTTGTSVVTYDDTGLTANTTYYYRVRATGSVGNGNYSDVASATTDAQVPAAPSGLTATQIGASANAKLQWTDNASDETGFKIESSPDGSAWTEIDTVGADVEQDNVNNADNLYFRVRAYNANGDSAYSNVVHYTP
jgi:hypothetical protein